MFDDLVLPRAGISFLPHQDHGVRWMVSQEASDAHGGILADDMGLGKTFQTIGLLKNAAIALRTLIVCPPVLLAAWSSELRACGFAVSTLTGTATWSDGGRGSESDTVWLCTYPKVVLHYKSLAKERFQRIILDEGHAIRNGEGTARWKSCMSISADAVARWILSATPIQNGKSDWRNLCAWLRIPETATDCMLRRTMDDLRSDIAALPPSPHFVHHTLTISESSAEGSLFRVLCDSAVNAFESSSLSVFMKLERWMRIQQFLVHPQIYVEAMRSKLGVAYKRPDWTGSSTKWDACYAQIVDAVSASVPTIVFCQFRAEMDRVAAASAALGAAVFSIRGGSDVGLEVERARAAASAGGAVVVVVQILCGGVGLNLQFCQRILFLSQHWNPAVVHQAIGRAVRIGQSAVVDVHFFAVSDEVVDNLDRRIAELHSDKIEVARSVCQSLYAGFPSSSVATT